MALLQTLRDRRQANGRQTPLLDALLAPPSAPAAGLLAPAAPGGSGGLLAPPAAPAPGGVFPRLASHSNALLGLGAGLLSGGGWQAGFQGLQSGVQSDQGNADRNKQQQDDAARLAAFQSALQGAPMLDDGQRQLLGALGPDAGAGYLLDHGYPATSTPTWEDATENGVTGQRNVQTGQFQPFDQWMQGGGGLTEWQDETQNGVAGQRNTQTGEFNPYPDYAQPAATDPNAPPGNEQIDNENVLRNQFTQATSTFPAVRDAYQRVQAMGTVGTAASDISLIFAYMRMLDPTSTVREGEFATAQNATGIPGQITNLYNQALSGTRLNDDQRQDFLQQATTLYGSAVTQYNQTADYFADTASKYGMDPTRIVRRYDDPAAAPGAPGATPTPAPAAPAPPTPVVPAAAGGMPPPPPDVDPAEWPGLWALMTPEERAAFPQ